MLQPNHRAPPRNPRMHVAGASFAEHLIEGHRRALEGGAISSHQFEIDTRIARVLCGGDGPGGERTEAELLELERRHFVALSCNPLTQARIAHLRETGTVLRN
jgi:3-hydroxyacyl-CoA dehydrogenase